MYISAVCGNRCRTQKSEGSVNTKSVSIGNKMIINIEIDFIKKFEERHTESIIK